MNDDDISWYKGFWRTDALPLGLIVLMIVVVIVLAITGTL